MNYSFALDFLLVFIAFVNYAKKNLYQRFLNFILLTCIQCFCYLFYKDPVKISESIEI